MGHSVESLHSSGHCGGARGRVVGSGADSSGRAGGRAERTDPGTVSPSGPVTQAPHHGRQPRRQESACSVMQKSTIVGSVAEYGCNGV